MEDNENDDLLDANTYLQKLIRKSKIDQICFQNEIDQLLEMSRIHDMKLCTNVILEAYKYNYFDILEILLRREAFYSGIPGLTELHAASGYGLSEIVKYLLEEKHIDPNIECTFVKNDQLANITPLHFACGIGPEHLVQETAETVHYLLKFGADVQKTTSRLDSALHWASKFADENVVRLLLNYKADVNAINCLGYSPLSEACFYGNFDICRLLVEHGADVNIKQCDDRSPVHLVARGLLSEHDAIRTNYNDIIVKKLNERLEIVKYLHENGAVLECYDKDGLTPLMYACSSGNYALVEYLIEQCSNLNKNIINEHSKTGETCLMYAIESGNLDIIQLLLKHHVNINDQHEPSYLTAACFYGYPNIVKNFIEFGLDINEFSQTVDGVIFNPVYACCHSGSDECLELLLNANAKIDWKTSQGTTCLHAACYSDKASIKLVQLLCDYLQSKSMPLDLNLSTVSGETPLLMAIERNDYELSEYLLIKGANPNISNRDGCYPLHLACYNVRPDIVLLLLSYDADIEYSNENYPHPLVITTYKRDLLCSKILIESTKCSDHSVHDALIEALEKSFDDLVAEIIDIRPYLIPDDLKDKILLTLTEDKLDRMNLHDDDFEKQNDEKKQDELYTHDINTNNMKGIHAME
ncbi:unnamed protein product [Didymodactylos carnosus]|uniref:Uncharacterized protein n=1 Tax=Didymodactylos carnosus TaxID=1234261 RepID=A0A813XG10_9BILA|nr:unnamed protein product [Didymodactylos carnosus]CAF0875557.1 unnamed protein product [Didymodactylos carnosus]CAF3512155.1 unnamed protein product [Didymodactylos carnosus]CAF3662467.1 unnamed protein product [Didymodactylos carnosus]